ncbi:MAG TPA: putative metallopeptidase [Candidatus Omnitrophota bacterium]|nr:putative metallopeptidase [Candidatus Omnitrophota bacterium]
MKYEYAPDLQMKAEEISRIMFPHIKLERIKCFRSRGSSSRGTIARCHALGKILQKTIGVEAYYALEFLSERFDKLDDEEKIKVIMHELMHIPKTFGGGFKHHDFVCERNVNLYYKEYKKRTDDKRGNSFNLFRN